MEGKIRIGALISGTGTNLKAIIKACNDGTINGKVVFVGSDTPEAKGLMYAKKEGIPTFVTHYSEIIKEYRSNPYSMVLPSDLNLDKVLLKQTLFSTGNAPSKVRDFFLTRIAAEARMVNKMEKYPFDLLILAGFMRTLTPYFIDKINKVGRKPRIMNIHPALLPSFPGIDGYGDTFRYGCKVAGCTVHFVDYGEDTGPIIGQRAFNIEWNDTLETIKEKGLKLEWTLYPECIQLFADNALKIETSSYMLQNEKKIKRTIVRQIMK